MALILCYFLPNLVDFGAHCVKLVDKAITIDNRASVSSDFTELYKSYFIIIIIIIYDYYV